MTGKITDQQFLSMNKQCEEEIETATQLMAELEEQRLSNEDFKKHIDSIRKVLREAQKDAAQGIISQEFVNKYIDRIFVTPMEDSLRLEIKIFTGETSEKFLAKLRVRTGHTSKKMIEAYENSMK